MNNTAAPNANRLLWAGFFSIFAAGVGFAVRGRVLAYWAQDYGFTQKELGDISGGGLWGFGLIIIAVAVFADRIGYGKLMIFAFAMHVLSAILQMCTGAIHDAFGRDAVYWSLTVAMVLFSFGNGTCEVVVNPMVATLFPKQKTHYLNILHAGWPGGLITGGLISIVLNDWLDAPWILQMSMFLVPVAIYGVMMLGQRLPRSEAGEAGVSFTTMLTEFVAPILLLLLFIHALVGYVELGTDSWIQQMTGTLTTPLIATMLFTYTNVLMFTLRFFGGPMEQRLTPLGLLFCCAVIACCGLLLLGNATGVILCIIGVTVYGIGKTFFWPTMLAVVSERFPKGGALTLGTIGGIGMLSAGLLGAPGIGFQLDYFPAQELKGTNTLDRYADKQPKSFYGLIETKALDGSKVGLLNLAATEEKLKEEGKTQEAEKTAKSLSKTLKEFKESKDPDQRQLAADWPTVYQPHLAEDYRLIKTANVDGTHTTFLTTAMVPAAMAVLYLLLLGYFRLKGGYKRLEVSEEAVEKSEAVPWE